MRTRRRRVVKRATPLNNERISKLIRLRDDGGEFVTRLREQDRMWPRLPDAKNGFYTYSIVRKVRDLAQKNVVAAALPELLNQVDARGRADGSFGLTTYSTCLAIAQPIREGEDGEEIIETITAISLDICLQVWKGSRLVDVEARLRTLLDTGLSALIL
jgi:hypothetical protein